MNKYEQMDTYQEDAKTFDIAPPALRRLYMALGLAGEAGEVADKVKKLVRDRHNISNLEELTQEEILAVILELGDVLWYVAMLADEMGYSLSEVATINANKLQVRMLTGNIKGSGDYR